MWIIWMILAAVWLVAGAAALSLLLALLFFIAAGEWHEPISSTLFGAALLLIVLGNSMHGVVRCWERGR